MLIDSGVPKGFWVEALKPACYLISRCIIRSLLEKTPFELLNERKPKLTYLSVFGCKCFILNNGNEALGKFDAKSDEEIFLGYSSQSKAYKVYNKGTQCVEESVHVIFDESHESSRKGSHNKKAEDGEFSKVPGEAIDIANGKTDLMSQVKVVDVVSRTHDTRQISGSHTSVDVNDGSNVEEPGPSNPEVQVSNWKHKSSHPLQNVITLLDSGIQIRSKTRNMFAFLAFLYQIEHKNIKEALKDVGWIAAMQEEIHQFERNKVWHLVPRPSNRTDWNRMGVQEQA
ncbi:uncharacterized protein LOC142177089 [Nicotiana tabacum]|uniref:Uncharacterized protein LOC142177089 n=1 Tax=Nicotiana tabacum TaxID=4097 RepID=A0AC58TWP1_TOBAC